VTDATTRRGVVRATVLVALSACCFGSISPLTLIALDHGVALQGIQAWRYATTALLFIAYAAWRPTPAQPPAPGAPAPSPWYSPRVILIAGGGQATVATLALLALRWIPAATEAFLFYTFPAWVAIIMAVRGVERIDGTRALALALALGGIVVMVGAPDAASLHPIGVGLALGAGVVYALYIPILGTLQRDRAPLDVSRAITVGGSLIFLTWALVTGTLFANFDAVAMAASVGQGVLSAGAFLGFLAGLRTLGAVRTSITSTVEPFWTSLLGVAVLAQPLSVGTMVGGLLIMCAVLILQRPSVAKPRLHSS
jgi:drug/metabolite transporter (DMT)-like permease